MLKRLTKKMSSRFRYKAEYGAGLGRKAGVGIMRELKFR